MTRFTQFFIVALVLLAFAFRPCLASADSLQLRDGRHLDGRYVGGTESMVAFFANGSVEYFPVTNVLLVVFGQGPVPDSLGGSSGLPAPSAKPMTSRQSNRTNRALKKVQNDIRNSADKPVLQTVSSRRSILHE